MTSSIGPVTGHVKSHVKSHVRGHLKGHLIHPIGRVLRVSALVLSAIAAGAVHAHSYVFTLGDAAASTHYFGVICSSEGGNDTDHLFLQLRTTTPNAPPVSAQVIKGPLATNTTDTVSGDVGFSAASRTRGGNGVYQVLINKAGPGIATFSVNAHCLDITGTQHTGTDGVVYQYQDR